MKKYLPILVILLVASLSGLQAQLKLDTKVDLGVAWMKRNDLNPKEWRSQPWWGAQVGVTAQYGFSSVISAEAQLVLNQIATRQRSNNFIENSPGYSVRYSRLQQNISCLSLPIYAGFKLDWIRVLLGFQFNAMLGNNQNGRVISSNSLRTIVSPQTEIPMEIRKFSMGPTVGLVTPISKRFFIEASYYHGLTNIAQPGPLRPTWHVRQVTYGLRYMFFAQP